MLNSGSEDFVDDLWFEAEDFLFVEGFRSPKDFSSVENFLSLPVEDLFAVDDFLRCEDLLFVESLLFECPVPWNSPSVFPAEVGISAMCPVL